MLWCQHNRKGLRKLWRCYGGVELLLWNGGVGWGVTLGCRGVGEYHGGVELWWRDVGVMVGWSCYGGVEGWWRDGSVMAGWRYYGGVMGRC